MKNKYDKTREQVLLNLSWYISINRVSKRLNISWRTAKKYVKKIEKDLKLYNNN